MSTQQGASETCNQLQLSRRQFFGWSATASLGLIGTGVSLWGCGDTNVKNRTGSSLEKTIENDSDKHADTRLENHVQRGFLFDSKLCIACGQCVDACRNANAIPEPLEPYRHIIRYAFTDGSTRSLSYSCMHCADPACLRVCPAGAISKRASDGIVVVDGALCLGCKYCYQACPFGVPQYDEEGMHKCDYCLSASAKEAVNADKPACVRACAVGALLTSTMEELDLFAKKHEAIELDAPTSPSFYLA